MSDILDETTPRLFEPLYLAKVSTRTGEVQSVPCVLLAAEATLRAVGHVPGRRRPRGWVRYSSRLYLKRDGSSQLRIKRSSRRRSRHWMIERIDILKGGPLEALAFPFGPMPMPIWAGSYQAAMRIAEHCHSEPRPSVAGGWVTVPDGSPTIGVNG